MVRAASRSGDAISYVVPLANRKRRVGSAQTYYAKPTQVGAAAQSRTDSCDTPPRRAALGIPGLAASIGLADSYRSLCAPRQNPVMAQFQENSGDWTNFRKIFPGIREIDFHAQPGDLDNLTYHERMEQTYQLALENLRRAQQEGLTHIMFIHGWSTSRLGATTHRSQVRKAMRSKAATPFLIRKNCIQHYSVFVAAIRRLN